MERLNNLRLLTLFITPRDFRIPARHGQISRRRYTDPGRRTSRLGIHLCLVLKELGSSETAPIPSIDLPRESEASRSNRGPLIVVFSCPVR